MWIVRDNGTLRATRRSRAGYLEFVEGVGGYSQSSVVKPDPRKLLLVHGLDDHASRHANAARCFCRQQDLSLGHSTPPSSRPNLPWSIQITVASSSCRPRAEPLCRNSKRASSRASSTRNASSSS